jgi:hypothetical protein
MYDPFPSYSSVLQQQQNEVTNYYTFATSELTAQGAPDTAYMDIGYISGKIVRLSDSAIIATLPMKDKFYFFPRLRGLYRKAMENKLYP